MYASRAVLRLGLWRKTVQTDATDGQTDGHQTVTVLTRHLYDQLIRCRKVVQAAA